MQKNQKFCDSAAIAISSDQSNVFVVKSFLSQSNGSCDGLLLLLLLAAKKYTTCSAGPLTF